MVAKGLQSFSLLPVMIFRGKIAQYLSVCFKTIFNKNVTNVIFV